MAIYLFLIFTYIYLSIKPIEKLSRRYFINSYDVFNIQGLTVLLILFTYKQPLHAKMGCTIHNDILETFLSHKKEEKYCRF